MSREALHESLSAVMDNEADELELRRVLAASGDAEVRAAWSRLQIARAAMHKELLEPHLDLTAAVSAAIADDEAPAAPAPQQPEKSKWAGLGRIAVAASVTVAVLAGVKVYNQSDVGGPQLAAKPPVQQATQPALVPQAQSPAVLAGYSDQPGDHAKSAPSDAGATSWQEQRLPEYLRQHAQQPAFSQQNGSLGNTGAEAR